MKIVYVSETDLAGSRFNGHDLQMMLNKIGHTATQFVISKEGGDSNTKTLIKTKGGYFIQERCKKFEDSISMQSVVYPFGEFLETKQEFIEADIVHYHLILNHYISLYSFKKLAQAKPTVWTLHDPWALTGHCVHPLDCKGWLTGCRNCPYLERYSPLSEDHSESIWNIKKDIYKNIDIDIVVASEWMYKMVKESPLMKHFERVHMIPFGIDLRIFKKRLNVKSVKEKLGIPKDNFVLMFRQSSIEWKGLSYIKEMLNLLDISRPVSILTVGETGLLDEYKKRFQIIEYKWINDNEEMVDLYSCSDLFLMTSIAESFGMMAIEAMACKLPVVIFGGTALPSVTFAPDCGILIEKGNAEIYAKTIKSMHDSPKELQKRGELGRQLAEKNYDIEQFNKKTINLYERIFKRNN